jgi:hypothetical protein
MRIEALSRKKIIVELAADDLTALDISYEALDYSSIETRRVIWLILDRVRETTGCDIDPSGQLVIDAMPAPAGGCILFFTLKNGAGIFAEGAEPARVLRKQDQLTIAFEFPGIDPLLDCAQSYLRNFSADKSALVADSALYEKNGLYRLLLCPAQEIGMVKHFFSEYGRFCGEESVTVARTREFWVCKSASDALQTLGGDVTPAPASVAKPFRAGSVYVSC